MVLLKTHYIETVFMPLDRIQAFKRNQNSFFYCSSRAQVHPFCIQFCLEICCVLCNFGSCCFPKMWGPQKKRGGRGWFFNKKLKIEMRGKFLEKSQFNPPTIRILGVVNFDTSIAVIIICLKILILFLNFVIGVTALLTFSCYHYCWNISGTTTSADVVIAPANNVFAFITLNLTLFQMLL